MPETGKNQPEMILGVQTVARKVLPDMPILLIFVKILDSIFLFSQDWGILTHFCDLFLKVQHIFNTFQKKNHRPIMGALR